MTKDHRNTTAATSPARARSRWLLDVEAQADPTHLGGKARSLQGLAALGLATPPAFVVTDEAFRALVRGQHELLRSLEEAPWPPGFEDELGRALDRWEAAGARAFAVRSSFAHEDDASALAAGVYLSELPVTKADVSAAVRRVWASAFSPAARAYAERTHQTSTTDGPLAVLVHPYVEARAFGSVAFSPATGEGEPFLDGHGDDLGEHVVRCLEAGARRAADAWGSADLEWAVSASGEVIFLQGRPDTRRHEDDDPTWRAALGGRGDWTWDAAHNPLPLSPAQAGLVAHVNDALALPFEMQVVHGYLFYRPRHAAAPPPLAEVAAAWRAWRPGFLARLEAAGTASAAPREALDHALALYREGYAMIFGSLQPALGKARAALQEAVRRSGVKPDLVTETVADCLRDVPSSATRRRALARALGLAETADAERGALEAYLAAFGEEASAWDVASPTWRERPDELLRRLRRRDTTPKEEPTEKAAGRAPEDADAGHPPSERGLARVGSPAPGTPLAAAVADAREAVALGEDDDALFARLQNAVRRALLALGQDLTARGRLAASDDVFFLAWPDELALALEGLRSLDATAKVRREARREALQSPPPAAYALGSSAGARTTGDPWQGQPGAPGRIVGRVVFHTTSPDPEAFVARAGAEGPRVLVAATLLPTELPLVEADALVIETGGPLGHVASQARERGLPAVVGLARATQLLRAGQRVLVDGDRGRLTLLEDDVRDVP